MDSNEIKGKAKDIAGRVERQAGEWTGNEDLQAKGLKDQAAGKAQNAYGKVKDAARDAVDSVKKDNRNESDVERDRDLERKDEDVA